MDVYECIKQIELDLVPDVVIPPKFKVMDFKKYDGTKCLKAHWALYCNKMYCNQMVFQVGKKIRFAHGEIWLEHFWDNTCTC